MGRPDRIQFPGAFYHVMSRGNAKQEIYLSDDDRCDFIEKLAEVISKFSWECYAYCLMDTHYHLLIETPQANLSEGMHKLNSDYCKRFNWKHKKAGHLFQERYYSPLIERVEHLHAVIRYIPLNPVKEGLVSDPGRWRWSSYRAIIGLTPAPAFLDISYILNLFSDDIETARQAYIHFVSERLTDKEGRIALQSLFQGVSCRDERNRAIRIAHIRHGYTAMEIATYLGISLSTTNRALRK